MTSFLRLFREFRTLEAIVGHHKSIVEFHRTEMERSKELCDTRGEAMRAFESENGSLARIIEDLRAERLQDQSRIVELTKEIVTAKDSEINAIKIVADFTARLRFGRSMFAAGVISEIPQREEAQHQPIARTKMQASAVVEQLEKEFNDLMNSGKPEAVHASNAE